MPDARHDHGSPTTIGIAIIGAGFSGLCMGIRLRMAGITDFRIFEKESDVGGTWRVNHYPGCACDVQSHLYSFSFEPNPDWTRQFAPQPEIRRYLEHCADKYELRGHIQLNTSIEATEWDASNAQWRLQDVDGRHYQARVLVAAIGALSTPAYPAVPGAERFRGSAFHSQHWDHDCPLQGRRVGVIGTGASTIQFVPEVQKQAARLSVFQRSPPWILPKPDYGISARQRLLFRRLPWLQRLRRRFIYWLLEARFLPMAVMPGLLRYIRGAAKRHIHSQIRDPGLRQKVTPDYEFGCKRVLMSSNYYPALDASNTDLITTPIEAITENGVRTSDGAEYELDVIIYGTGFRATDPVPRGLIRGSSGIDLVDAWRKGPEAYKGTTVHGFPNFFMIMGPNTGLGHNSMIYMIESQVQYTLEAIRTMEERGLSWLDVKPEYQRRYNAGVQERLKGSVWNTGGCTSWYIHPGTGKNIVLWPDFTFRFARQTRRFDPVAYTRGQTQRATESQAQSGRDNNNEEATA